MATKRISGKSARGTAAIFHYGNIAAYVIPFPVLIFWAGASMMVYAMTRHHPNPKVGRYTQQGAFLFYAVTGAVIVIGTFFPAKVLYFLIYWGIGAAIVIPWSIWSLIQIHRDQWDDVEIETDTESPG